MSVVSVPARESLDAQLHSVSLHFHDDETEEQFHMDSIKDERIQQVVVYRMLRNFFVLVISASLLWSLVIFKPLNVNEMRAVAARLFLVAMFSFLTWSSAKNVGWRPWYAHWACTLAAILGLYQSFFLDSVPLAGSVVVGLRIAFTVMTRGNWLAHAFFQFLDMLAFFGMCSYFVPPISILHAMPLVLLHSVLMIYTAYHMEYTIRIKYLMRMLLSDHLTSEQRRRESAEKMIRFMSHEVRNPQNAILLAIESLLAEAGTSRSMFKTEQLHVLEVIRSSAEFISSLLEDVLNFQRLSNNKVSLELKPVVLRYFITELAHSVELMFMRTTIHFECTCDPALPCTVMADKHRIRQVITNFISNAIKFTQAKGRIHLVVSLDLNVEGRFEDVKSLVGVSTIGVSTGPHVKVTPTHKLAGVTPVVLIRFAVHDTGSGISADNQQLLFHEFSQINPGELQNGKGMGLGLNICKGMVELHGGRIGVNSVVGVGSEFFCVLPLQVVCVVSDSSVMRCHAKNCMRTPPITPGPSGSSSAAAWSLRRATSLKAAGLDGVGRVDQSASSQSTPSLPSMSPSNFTTIGHISSAIFSNAATPARSMLQTPAVQSFSSGRSPRTISHLQPYRTPRHSASAAAIVSGLTTTKNSLATLLPSRLFAPPAYTCRNPAASCVRPALPGIAPFITPAAVKTKSATSSGSEHGRDQILEAIEEKLPSTDLADTVSPLELPSKPRMRVLVADDNLFIRQMLAHLLPQLGYDCVCVVNGKEAHDLLLHAEPGEFHLAIFDSTMPVMTGLEAVALLRAAGLTMPFLGLTGSTDSAEMEAFLLAGVNLVLFKPVKSSELAHVMDGLLGRTPGRSVVFCSNRMGVQMGGVGRPGGMSHHTTSVSRRRRSNVSASNLVESVVDAEIPDMTTTSTTCSSCINIGGSTDVSTTNAGEPETLLKSD